MEEKKNNVIGMAEPVVDEVENIGVINPDILKKVKTTEEKVEEEPVQQEPAPTPVVAQEPAEPQPVQPQAPQQQTQQQQYNPRLDEVDENKKILAGLMGIFFGAFGVHNFIYGYTGKGIAQVLITVLSCFLLSWVSSIWGLIEGIMILTGSIKPNNR